MESDALTAALRALQQLASDRSYDKRRDTDDDDVDDAPLAYDPASIFLLETMVSISCHRPDHIEETWYVTSARRLINLIVSKAHRIRASFVPPLDGSEVQHASDRAGSRGLVAFVPYSLGQGTLSFAWIPVTSLTHDLQPSLRDQLYVALDVLGGLRPEVSNAVAEQIISGLALVVRGHHTVIRYACWNIVEYFINAHR